MAYPVPEISDKPELKLHRVIASSFPPIDLFEDVSPHSLIPINTPDLTRSNVVRIMRPPQWMEQSLNTVITGLTIFWQMRGYQNHPSR